MSHRKQQISVAPAVLDSGYFVSKGGNQSQVCACNAWDRRLQADRQEQLLPPKLASNLEPLRVI